MTSILPAAGGARESAISGSCSILGWLGGSDPLISINLITLALSFAASEADSFNLDLATFLAKSSALTFASLVE